MGSEPIGGGWLNTDHEIWRRVPGDYYSPSLHVTQDGAIGINVGGHVVIAPVEALHSSLCVRPPSDYVDQDLDTLLAIDDAATPGEWKQYSAAGRTCYAPGRSCTVFECHNKSDAAAIVSAKNALRPLVERCKQAELEYQIIRADMDQWRKLADTYQRALESANRREAVADLTSERAGLLDQRDAQIAAADKLRGELCGMTRQRDELLAALEYSIGWLPHDAKIKAAELVASVKGGADGKA